MSNRDVILIFPPNFAVDQPYLALPALVGYMRANSVDDVQQWDCNIDSFWHFLEEESLQGALARVKAIRSKLEARDEQLTSDEQEKYRTLCGAELASGPVLENITEAKAYFTQQRDKTCLDEYNFNTRVISKAFEIISAAYYPSEISARDFSTRYSCQHSEDILEAASSPENPYLDYFAAKTIPRLIEANPSLVGLSVACMSQIIPSFTLAKLIRQALPATKIVFGGQVFNRLIEDVMRLPRLFQYVDYLVFREGETALLELIRHLKGKIGIDQVPNLVFFDQEREKAVKTDRVYVEDVETLPPPDFSDLDLSRYLSPAPVLPYQPVRGCYWHRCAFCNHFAIHPPRERAKTPDQAVSELRYLQEAYGTKYFTIVNESVRPQLLRDYAAAMLRADLDLEWYVGARLEPELDTESLTVLKQSGCRKIYFGLESGSQNVLDAMRKGISLCKARRILKDCGDLDIAVHLFLMLGFPTESLEDLHTSKAIIYELASLVPRDGFTYYISIYQLKPCSAIFQNPSSFQICSIQRRRSGRDLEYLYQFDVADRGGEIDYEAERHKMEQMLDQTQGVPCYPENIIHYLTMRKCFDTFRDSEVQGHDRMADGLGRVPEGIFQVRRGLGFAAFRHLDKMIDAQANVTMEQRTHCIYDLVFDEVFAIENGAVWRVLQGLSGTFGKKDLQIQLQKNLGQADNLSELACRIAKDLLESHLVIPAQ